MANWWEVNAPPEGRGTISLPRDVAVIFGEMNQNISPVSFSNAPYVATAWIRDNVGVLLLGGAALFVLALAKRGR